MSNIQQMRPGVVRYYPTFCLYQSHVTTVKAYGELPENAKINETETFGEEDGECAFEFGDDEEVDIDDI